MENFDMNLRNTIVEKLIDCNPKYVISSGAQMQMHGTKALEDVCQGKTPKAKESIESQMHALRLLGHIYERNALLKGEFIWDKIKNMILVFASENVATFTK